MPVTHSTSSSPVQKTNACPIFLDHPPDSGRTPYSRVFCIHPMERENLRENLRPENLYKSEITREKKQDKCKGEKTKTCKWFIRFVG